MILATHLPIRLIDTTTAGNYGEYFTISGNQLKSKRPFNYEKLASMNIEIRSTDNGGDYVDQIIYRHREKYQ